MNYLLITVILLSLLLFNCSENSTSSNLSGESEIFSFLIESNSLVGEIDNINKTIRIKITPDIDRTNLTPTILISLGATITPASGVAQDFNDTLNYRVTAKDGSVTNYKVYTDVGNYILNSCLHIVHMQKYFINSLGIHNRTSVVTSISNILTLAREEDIPVVFSKSLPEFNRNIVNELIPFENEIVIESSNDQPVINAINSLQIKNVVVVGVLTHACVRDVCIELRSAGYNVFLVEDATSVLLSQDINLIESTCNELEQNGKVKLRLSSDIIF